MSAPAVAVVGLGGNVGDSVRVLGEALDALGELPWTRHQHSLAELEEARAAAKGGEKPQAAAMVAATMGKAKLLGFLTEKVEHTGKDGGPVEVVHMTPEAIRKVMEKDDC